MRKHAHTLNDQLIHFLHSSVGAAGSPDTALVRIMSQNGNDANYEFALHHDIQLSGSTAEFDRAKLMRLDAVFKQLQKSMAFFDVSITSSKGITLKEETDFITTYQVIVALEGPKTQSSLQIEYTNKSLDSMQTVTTSEIKCTIQHNESTFEKTFTLRDTRIPAIQNLSPTTEEHVLNELVFWIVDTLKWDLTLKCLTSEARAATSRFATGTQNTNQQPAIDVYLQQVANNIDSTISILRKFTEPPPPPPA